ncbi:hypothetical protein HPP92_004946 [Vanilla planifolia]|uniref:Uncharacterized protein n=1 Tax=Vanilla planifolia TaxID=51239 RepID=A0A835RJC1_VANPL|nr:hypothetical protein HPP92_004946 [Vanilla planifolia]
MHYPVQSSRITTTKSKLWFTICPPYLDAQRKAVKRIRMLSKNPENRVLIAKFRGIPSRIHLLSYPDLKLQENTVTSLLNLSIDEANKQLITEAGAIPFIIDVLKSGTTEARENSAAGLFQPIHARRERESVAGGSLEGQDDERGERCSHRPLQFMSELDK